MRIRISDLKPLVLGVAIVAGLAMRADHADAVAHAHGGPPCEWPAEHA